MLIAHRQDVHLTGAGSAEGNLDFTELQPVLTNIRDPEIADVYNRHRYAIARRHRRLTDVREVYNFPVLDETISTSALMNMIEEIFDDRTDPFRLNFAFGYILESSTGQEAPRYFHPYRNVHELKRSVKIASKADLAKLRRRLGGFNFEEKAMAQRPASNWQPNLLTNVRFDVCSGALNEPLGCRGVFLPEFIMRKKGIVDFVRSDNLCFFRCLAHFLGSGLDEVDKDAIKLLFKWKEGADISTFPGVEVCDLDDLERLFQINITIFCLQPERAELVRATRADHERTMYLNAFDGHCSLITHLESFIRKYTCPKCSLTFGRSDHLQVHVRTCTGDDGGDDDVAARGDVDRKYVGGFFKHTPNVFQRLREAAIPVDPEEEDFPWFACFDIECILADVPQDERANSSCISEHRCVSIAVSSNVPGFQEPVCFVDPSTAVLVEQMLQHLTRVQEKASELAAEQLERPREMLADKIEACACVGEKKRLRRLLSDLQTYSRQLPVLGFNSSRYDILALRKHLLPQLGVPEDDDAFVCKKNSTYTCIKTYRFSFLDCLSFLSPGTSLDDFLKSYSSGDPEQRKIWFPYEKMRCWEDLENTDRPAYDDYYSHLKGHNTLESERRRYEQLLGSGLSEKEALAKMGLDKQPATGQQNFQRMNEIWDEQNMTCLRDLLVYYNVQDVQPMIAGLTKLRLFYRECHKLNLYKDAITIAGASRIVLFETASKEGASFSLMNKDEAYLQEEVLEQGICGGPSLVFNRYQEQDKTYLHGNDGPLCRAIHGYDANR